MGDCSLEGPARWKGKLDRIYRIVWIFLRFPDEIVKKANPAQRRDEKHSEHTQHFSLSCYINATPALMNDYLNGLLFLPFFRKGKKDPVYPVILSGRDKMACQEAAEGD